MFILVVAFSSNLYAFPSAMTSTFALLSFVLNGSPLWRVNPLNTVVHLGSDYRSDSSPFDPLVDLSFFFCLVFMVAEEDLRRRDVLRVVVVLCAYGLKLIGCSLIGPVFGTSPILFSWLVCKPRCSSFCGGADASFWSSFRHQLGLAASVFEPIWFGFMRPFPVFCLGLFWTFVLLIFFCVCW